jgi:copper transport protein
MADSTFREVIPVMPQVMRETFAGRVWTWRLATALLLALVAWVPAPGRFATASICGISAVLIAMQSITSHAVDKGAFAIGVHFAHQAAAGLWIGALVSLLIGATYGHAGAEWLRAATSRVSMIAGWSVAALVVTGAIRAWDALGLQLDLLVNSIYGRTLLWKVGTAATVILIGGYNRYRLVGSVGESSARASLIRNVAVECALLAVVIGWSVVLANTPPPH